MTDRLEEYKRLIDQQALALKKEDSPDFDDLAYDSLLDRLDDLWYEMTDSEIDQARAYTAKESQE